MFCVKCGNIIQPGMAFCTKCGNPVKQKASAGEQQNEAGNGTEAVTSASGQAEAAQKTAAEAGKTASPAKPAEDAPVAAGTEKPAAAAQTAAGTEKPAATAQTAAEMEKPAATAQTAAETEKPAAAAQAVAGGSATVAPAGVGNKKKRSALPVILIMIGVLAVAAAVVFAVVSRSSYRSVKLESYDGKVELERDGDEEEIFEGLKLQADDRVTTGEDGVAELLIDSDKHLVASENTSFSIRATGNQNSGKVTIRLEYGTTLAEIDNRLNEDSEFEIVTPNATCSVRGTVYKVSYDPNLNMTRIDVSKGTVRVKTASDKLDLNAGESAVVVDETIYPIDPSLGEEELIEYLESLGVLEGTASDEEETGSYSVVVVGANEVGTLGGAEVSLYAEEEDAEPVASDVTGGDGRCDFEAVPVGTYDLVIRAEGYNERTMQIEIASDPGELIVPMAPEIINDDCCILLEWEGDQDLDICVFNEDLGEYINTAHPADSTGGGFLYADHNDDEGYELFYLHDMSHEIRKTIYVLDRRAAQALEESSMEAEGVRISVYSIDGLCYEETADPSRSASLWNPCYVYAGEVLTSDPEYITDLSEQAWISLEEADQFAVSTDWAAAYLAQLEAGDWEWGVERIGAATVLDLDEDNIPEIVVCVSENIQAGGPYDCVYSYKNGEVISCFWNSLDGIDYDPAGHKLRMLLAWGDPREVISFTDSGFASGGGNDGDWQRIRYDMTRQELVDYLTGAAGSPAAGSPAASGNGDEGSASAGEDLSISGEWSVTKDTGDTLGFILNGDGNGQMISNGKYVTPATYTYDGDLLTISGGGVTWILERDGDDFRTTSANSSNVIESGLRFRKV